MEQPFKEGMEEGQERIAAAALSYHGEEFTGVIHADAFEALINAHDDYVEGDVIEGYMTSVGRFVTREEAAQVGKASGQIDASQVGELRSGDFSQAA